MKKLSFLSAVCVLALFLPNLGFAESAETQLENLLSSSGSMIYTAHNLYADDGAVTAINFKVGRIIPAGTQVKVILAGVQDFEDVPPIQFKTVQDGEVYTLEFTRSYHPGKTIYEYANLMFGTDTFEALTVGKNPEIVDAIRRAAIIRGMTKDEVLMSYGYPAEHKTLNLKENTWVYWKDRFKQKKVCFSEEEKTILCGSNKTDL